MLRHGSLFSGIGGFDLAAEWMGWENMFHCEWNQFGQNVLKYYWPNAISYDDICKTDFTIWRGRIDILTGGFPCQPYSMAGKRQGTEDARHLWPEMLRAIRECRPTWIVGENVPGLINWSKGLVFEQVCADLEGEGYEVQPVVLPASGVNAPHRRDRVWFVAHLQNKIERKQIGYDGGRETKELEPYNRDRIRDSVRSTFESGIITIPNENGRGGDERKEESSIGRFGDIGTGDNERVRTDLAEIGVITNTNHIRQPRKEHRQIEPGRLTKTSVPTDWTDWPTVAPLCRGNDGLSERLVGITFPKWRNESIKAFGNSVVVPLVYQIFKVINEYETSIQTKKD